MKIIELLNKIANGELDNEITIFKFKNVIYGAETWCYVKSENVICEYRDDKAFYSIELDINIGDLNDEIEIILTEKVEKLDINIAYTNYLDGYNSHWSDKEKILIDKINELIDNQNEINKKLKEAERE